MNARVGHLLDEVLGLAVEERSALAVAPLDSLETADEATVSEPRRDSDHLPSAEARQHVVIGILLAVATLLLFGFTAVVHEMTQRGALRGVHQNASGSLTLPNELATRAFDVLGLVSLTSDKLVGR